METTKEIVEPEEPAPIKVSPSLQNEMRSTARKTMKRGRKSKAKGKKAGNTNLKRQKSKRQVLKAHLKASKQTTVESTQHAKGKGSKSRGKRHDPQTKLPKPEIETEQTTRKRNAKKGKADSSATAESTHQHVKVSQNKVEDTKGRIVYEVLENQEFGCCCCRWIFNGCKICRNPNFKGKSVAARRAEQECAEQEKEYEGSEAVGGETEQEAAGTKPARKYRKKRKTTVKDVNWCIGGHPGFLTEH